MTTPNIDHGGDDAALGEIEADAGRLLGLDLTSDLGPLDRLRLNQATSLLIELSRIDHQQQQGLAIDPIQRGRMSGELAALISPAGPSADLSRLDLTALTDRELSTLEILGLKAARLPIEDALDPPPLDPASAEGKMLAALEAKQATFGRHDQARIDAAELEASRARAAELTAKDEARALRAERDKQAADIVEFRRLVQVFIELSERKGTPLPADLPPNVVPFKPPPGAA
jgi:hypothetical protein